MRKEVKKEKVLSDHVPENKGRRLVPPMIHHLGPFGDPRWTERIIPEIIWIGLLNKQHGLHRGAELSLAVAKAAVSSVDADDTKLLFAGVSAYGALNQIQQNNVVRSLEESQDTDAIKEALAPLIHFYPKCPMGFIAKNSIPHAPEEKEGLELLKEVLASMFNRWNTPATMAQANAVYIAFITDRLKVAEGLALAKFPAIEEFPDTEESRRVASGVRGAVSMFFGPGGQWLPKTEWPDYFWNRGLELESCRTS